VVREPESFVHESGLSGFGRKGTLVEQLGGVASLEVGAGLCLGGVVTGSAKARAVGGVAVGAWVANGVVAGGLKIISGRLRPGAAGGPDADSFKLSYKPVSGRNSFPSGHTSAAFSVATVIATAYPSPWVRTASYGVASMVGVGRIVQDRHWTSDVVAGAILGYEMGKLAVHVGERTRWGPALETDGRRVYVEAHF
jgi:membrane-associated phospholipid phosphatase